VKPTSVSQTTRPPGARASRADAMAMPPLVMASRSDQIAIRPAECGLVPSRCRLRRIVT